MSDCPIQHRDPVPDWIDAVADQFEAAWQKAPFPRIAAFLSDESGERRAALLMELIQVDLACRAKVGGRRQLADYDDEFPEIRQRIAADIAQPTPLPQKLVSQKAVTDRPNIVGYEILGELGEGGMGVVYKARHIRLGRVVALKMILAGARARRRDFSRFQTEMEAMARLQHPNIVQLYEVGEHDRQPYCALEYVDGGNLGQKLTGTPQPARQAAQLIETLARAIHAAHQQNVIHRDLKPANVLLTTDGAPKISDFGLAKQLTGVSQGEAPLKYVTQTGEVVGTPSYMSPEQAQGKPNEVCAPADVYGLGAILYELLTGRPPFKGETTQDTLEQVRTQEPVSPSRLQPKLPRDLTTICLKCLEKDLGKRYPSAEALAKDLRRFLDGKPIQARSVSHSEKLWRWCRRNPYVAIPSAAAVLLLVGLVTALSVSTVLVWRAKNGLSDSLERERQNSYYQRIALAEREWSANNLGRMEQLLEECPADLRGWEWHYLRRLHYTRLSPLDHGSLVLCVAFSPTGQYLASGGRNGAIKVWDRDSGQPLQTIRVGDRAGELMVFSVAFSADGLRLAAACSDGRVKVWDVHSGTKLLDWEAHSPPVGRVAFSPDGLRLASSRLDYGWDAEAAGGEVKVWHAATGRELLTLRGQGCVAFSPDGQRLATGGPAKSVKVWNVTTGQELWTSSPHTAGVATLAYSPDGQSLASAGADWSKLVHAEVKLWDARTGDERLTLHGHIGFVLGVAFSPDGQRLASGGMDRTVKLWDVATGRESLTLRGHKGAIQAVAFSPDGHQLASGGADQTVRVWDATPLDVKAGKEPLTLRVHSPGALGVAFHPDGQRLATVAGEGGVKLWDRHTGQALLTFPDSQGCRSIAISPEGQRLAGGKKEEVTIWDIRTGEKLHSLSGFKNVVKSMAFSPDGRRLVSAHWDRTVRMWDTTIAQEVFRIEPAHAFAIYGLALSPDERTAVTCSADETKVWDMATRRHIVTLQPRHPAHPTSVAFRPDGQVLASASTDGTIKLWDTQSWKQQGDDLRDPTGGMYSLAFSPNGRLLAWGSTDATVKIWDAVTKEMQSLRGHTSWVEDVAFSPDGKWIASASLDGTVKLWQVPEAKEPPAEAAGLAPAGGK